MLLFQRGDCGFPVTVINFWVNYVSPKPSKNGDFCILLNPADDIPPFERLEGRTSVTWQLWLKDADKASVYRNMLSDAVARSTDPKTGKPSKDVPVHRVFAQIPCTIRVKAGLTPNDQNNVLTLTGPVVKDVRVFTPPTSNDDFA